jgi:hypothetical protein
MAVRRLAHGRRQGDRMPHRAKSYRLYETAFDLALFQAVNCEATFIRFLWGKNVSWKVDDQDFYCRGYITCYSVTAQFDSHSMERSQADFAPSPPLAMSAKRTQREGRFEQESAEDAEDNLTSFHASACESLTSATSFPLFKSVFVFGLCDLRDLFLL